MLLIVNKRGDYVFWIPGNSWEQILSQSIMIDPNFSLGKIEMYLDAPALTSSLGHLRDDNRLCGTGQVECC
jgi:hypothetical protein